MRRPEEDWPCASVHNFHSYAAFSRGRKKHCEEGVKHCRGGEALRGGDEALRGAMNHFGARAHLAHALALGSSTSSAEAEAHARACMSTSSAAAHARPRPSVEADAGALVVELEGEHRRRRRLRFEPSRRRVAAFSSRFLIVIANPLARASMRASCARRCAPTSLGPGHGILVRDDEWRVSAELTPGVVVRRIVANHKRICRN